MVVKMKTSYPLCEKFGFPITYGDSDSIKPRHVEEFLRNAKTAYGFGSDQSGSFAYGPSMSPAGMEKVCLIVGMEDTKSETAESIAKEMEELMPNFLQSAEGVQKLKDMAERLCAKVLR